MKAVLKPLARAVHIAHYPIHIVVETLHVEEVAVLIKKKKSAKVAVGVVLMLTGSMMATHPVVWLPHFIWDTFAYGLHGYGALPIIKIACKHLNLEDIEEEVKEKVIEVEHEIANETKSNNTAQA